MDPRELQEIYTSKVLPSFFKSPQIRPFILEALTRIAEQWPNKNIFIVEAPTGYGKTTLAATISYYILKHGLKTVIAYPLRALIEDQYQKFLKLENKDLVGYRYMHHADSRYLIKPITLTTIDTLALNLFGISPEDIDKVVKSYLGTLNGSLGHYLFAWALTSLSTLVLDEVHLVADTTKSLSFLYALCFLAKKTDQKVILMSATLPRSLKSLFEEDHILGSAIEVIEFDEKVDQKFIADRLEKQYEIELAKLTQEQKYEYIIDYIIRNPENNKVLVIFNTVPDAIRFYILAKNNKEITKRFKNNIILLHSRFTESDRLKKQQALIKIKESNVYLIIATQVVEAGIDITSNMLITELAPANSLIQRFGRFLRYEGENKGKALIWYEISKENDELLCFDGHYKVYDKDLTQRTLTYLKSKSEGERLKINMHVPSSYRESLDSVYQKQDFQMNNKLIGDLITSILAIERMSLKALEILIKNEGSLIRDSQQFPAIPKDDLEKLPEAERNPGKIRSLSFPISFETIRKLKNIEILELHNDKIKTFRIDYQIKMESLIKKFLSGRAIAIVVPMKYSSELGAWRWQNA